MKGQGPPRSLSLQPSVLVAASEWQEWEGGTIAHLQQEGGEAKTLCLPPPMTRSFTPTAH